MVTDKATKLFCEMNGSAQVINWKLITRGMPRGRQASIDRAPTIEEIQRIIEYPDRRIKPIVFTMISSGIRTGAWDYLQWKHVIPMASNSGEMLRCFAIPVLVSNDMQQSISFPNLSTNLMYAGNL